ncbi:hypothetical protein ACFPM3_15240 [Streptomyces coeruleoprunus]|uniref:Uncharacterized protein n=1 Tax=Streptomyces coeruleoprunus TaxID=285563 RepID=A0ABV9XDG6_9ACTN
MFAYETHSTRHADLIREAAAERLARAARTTRKARRAARRSGGDAPEGRVSTDRDGFARAA